MTRSSSSALRRYVCREPLRLLLDSAGLPPTNGRPRGPARSLLAGMTTPLTHLRRQFARAYHWSRCRSRLSWEHLKHQHLLESTASKRAVRASTVTVKSARE